jgi:hypothetical protein
MNRIFSRNAYRLLLWLHPASFQYEFGPEMLWIFDEEPDASVYLLFDGALSLLRQRCRSKDDHDQLSITSGPIVNDPGIGPLRLLQGAITCFAMLYCFVLLLENRNPLGFSVQYPQDVACCSLTLQSSSQVDIVCKPAPKLP